MKIGILHFSDLHLTGKENNLLALSQKIQQACHFELNEISKLCIVVTGDIANTGKEKEYECAYTLFSELSKQIKEHNKVINSIKFIVVPGNHDCLLETDLPVRKALLQTVNKDDIEIEIINSCLDVQDNFWKFYSKIDDSELGKKISYQIKVPLYIDSSMIFNCYNSSWMSEKNESNNKIIPTSTFLEKGSNMKDITISVFHHPTSWLNPNTQKNNKKTFETHLLKTSNIVLCGHEHYNIGNKVVSLRGNEEFLYLEGGAFNAEGGNKSTFKFISIETNDFKGKHVLFIDNEKHYEEAESNEFQLSHSRCDINITDNFLKLISDITIPIKHPNVEHLTLEDVFTFPDLDLLTESEDLVTKRYEDAGDILNFKDKKIIIEGDNQSGRTSLLYMYYQKLFKMNYFPLYIKGKNINIRHLNMKDLLKNLIKQQYQTPFNHSRYIEKDISKRVILIDDIDSCDFNANGKNKLLEEFGKYFSKIIITTREVNEVHEFVENTKLYDGFKCYRIKPLGYYKRNNLIERWVRLGKDEYSLKEDEVTQSVKNIFDLISNLLGEQLIPSYPIFILSLLQSLDNKQVAFNISETSYAHCYNSLIILSLMRTGIETDKLGSILNFLTKYAYFLYKDGKSGLTQEQFQDFYTKYKDTFNFDFPSMQIEDILCQSNILKNDDGILIFTYKYLSYYLSAKEIASFIHEERGKKEIRKLCSNLHIEKNANILVFVTHHSADNDLIEELLITSLLPFENRKPITLDIKEDPFFTFLASFVETLRTDIVLRNTNPEDYRAKQLKKLDNDQQEKDLQISNRKYQITDDDFNDPNIVDVSQVLKIIKILGQIVKNQHGVFEKEKLESLIESSYLACFRLTDFFSEVLQGAREEIMDMIVQKLPDSVNKDIIQKKVSDFLYLLAYKLCLTVFSNLSGSIGTSSLKSVYDKVAEKIGSPAARLISFSIKTYYGTIDISELKNLMDEYKNNPVVTHIIKARVINHVYQNHVPFDKKQKIGSICNLKLLK